MRIFRIADAIERGKQERDTVESAVTLMRRLTAVLPRLDPSLAGMLRLLARSLSEEGHQEQALAAVEESVRICRHGIDTRRSRHDVQLVWSLRAQADILESLGRGEEAVAAAREAVALCRDRLPRNPRGFGPALLAALDTLARSLDALDETQAALPFGEERVRILRRLTAHRPQYEHMLAGALHQLGFYSSNAGQLTDALRATDEALQLYQRLPDQQLEPLAQQLGSATVNRDLFLDQLARAGKVVLGPYPLCAQCEQTNGGLVAVRHRQRHIQAGGKQSCVDHGLSAIIATLWEHGCDTRNSCQDVDTRAMVTPAAGQTQLAVNILADMGIHADTVDCTVYFSLPADRPSTSL
ncbi:tetratricopeptide repeat protein [Nocardia gipuzkoensis]|uniref:tetratricopeptide repeat protein n=1 Tax=Nocardia gipuzkoensis TaxID=2749991 RepID=UPI0015EFB43B|nr:tetratricopeptide repeat protein [Nocardia gipuzkoensis]